MEEQDLWKSRTGYATPARLWLGLSRDSMNMGCATRTRSSTGCDRLGKLERLVGHEDKEVGRQIHISKHSRILQDCQSFHPASLRLLALSIWINAVTTKDTCKGQTTTRPRQWKGQGHENGTILTRKRPHILLHDATALNEPVAYPKRSAAVGTNKREKLNRMGLNLTSRA